MHIEGEGKKSSVFLEPVTFMCEATAESEPVRPVMTPNPLVAFHNLPELWQCHQEIMQDDAGEAPSICHACQMSLISTHEQGCDEQFFHASNLSAHLRNKDKSKI